MAKAVTRMTIDDALHFNDEDRAEITAGYEPHMRDARTRGIPSMGIGRVYPVAQVDISVAPFQVPGHWALIAGIDLGWDHPTAAVQMAWDRDADVVYIGACYRKKEKTPIEHCVALKPWGEWLPWAWPVDATQHDKRSGGTLAQDYRSHGLHMLGTHAQFPDKGTSVEAGIMEILTRMQTQRLKVFAHLADWFEEFNMYHRKERPDGTSKIHKFKDDLMDATRYGIMMLRYAEPADLHGPDAGEVLRTGGNPVTGY